MTDKVEERSVESAIEQTVAANVGEGQGEAGCSEKTVDAESSSGPVVRRAEESPATLEPVTAPEETLAQG